MGVDAAAADRLPWLADEPARQPIRSSRRRSLLPWAAAALALVGTGGFWLGLRSANEARPRVAHSSRSMTIQLPPARPPASPEVRLPEQKEVRPAPLVEVRPVPSREVRITIPPRAKAFQQVSSRSAETSEQHDAEIKRTPPAASAPAAGTAPPSTAPADSFVLPRPWNPRLIDGAAGRLVQIGAFGSVTQAKRGWWFMTREYPAMAHLPAVVRPTRNSKGRPFYRFQVGTTSQAHSEVLCQRMEKISLSCAVVGLPWKAKVER